VTFTRRATQELQERLGALLPPGAGQCSIHSFHSLGLAILRTHGESIGLKPGFRIAGEPERRGALAKELQVTEARAATLLKAVSVLKRTGSAGRGEDAMALEACRRLAREQKWVDFDDLVALAVELLERNAAIAERWQSRFRYICADEFQDVDEQQYRLLHILARPHGNLCVIGDPNQAIYGFRGADAACFARFKQDFPQARTLLLGKNYRSTGTIVTAAAQVIGSCVPSDIIRPMLDPITLHVAASERSEADFVAQAIEDLIGGHDMLAANRNKDAAKPLGFADFAVLYRTDAQAAVLRDALDHAGIPFKKSTPAPIGAQKAVQMLLDAMEQRGETPLSKRIMAACDALRNEDAGMLAEARRWLLALADDDDIALLREKAALATEADFWDARADRVSLLTMHAAKGLEFAVVLIVGMEDGIVPFSWAEENHSDAEERRLFYVAMTRAKDRLFLSRAMQRQWRGQLRSLPPSPYLAMIDKTLARAQAPFRRRMEQRQYSLF
jgi:superfamily I DNA/RNA helicase